MRIAQRTISRNYMKSLNTSLSKRAESFERGTTGLKFSKLSDNVADGSRALHIQEERYKSTQQLSNVENLRSEMESVDSNMESIHSILQSIQEKTLSGMSENYGEEKREVLAQEISSMKEQILQFANAQFSGKFLFGNTNNSTAPFTVNAQNGKLQFNGIDVELIRYKDGEFVYTDPVDAQEKKVPNSDEIFADIGLGLKISDDMQADPRSAFQVSFSGLKLLGFGEPVTGKNGTKTASNVYDLLTQIEGALTPKLDKTAMDDLHQQLVTLTDQVGTARTDLGTRTAFLDRTKDRLEADIDNMSEMESRLISSDPAEEAIKMKECEYVWMAVLQLGSQILPSSLLDFMR
mgnify:FL=1